MSKIKFIITTIFVSVILTTTTAQATMSTQQLSHTSTKVNTGWNIGNGGDNNVNRNNSADVYNEQISRFFNFKWLIDNYYKTIKIYLYHFDLLYYIIKCNIEKKNNILPCNLYKFLNSEFGYTKESLEKKFKFSEYLPKYYDENCELDENLIKESFLKIEKIIGEYKNEIKKLDSFKRDFQGIGMLENNSLFKQVENVKCDIEKNIDNIKLKIKNIKEIPLKLLIDNYYKIYRIIKSYLEHFDVLNNILENKNSMLPLNLYRFLTEKCNVKKENIEKKFKFSPNLLKYYDEKCELDENLIKESFSEIEKIINNYKNEIKNLDFFKGEFQEYEIPKNDLPFKQVEDVKCDIEKYINNIKLKIENINKIISNKKNNSNIDINKKNNIEMNEKNNSNNLIIKESFLEIEKMINNFKNETNDSYLFGYEGKAEKYVDNIYSKIIDMKRAISNGKNNIENINVAATETISKLMDFKIIIKNYYRTIKNYLDHFNFLNYVTKWNKEKKNDACPFNLYKFFHSEFGLSKENFEKKFKSSPNLLKYYDEKCELDGNLIIKELSSKIEKIIGEYKNEIKNLDSFKRDFQEIGMLENNSLFKQVEDIKCDIEKYIDNTDSKIENIKKIISNGKNIIENSNMNGNMENDDLDIPAIETIFMNDDMENDDLDIATTETIFKLKDFENSVKGYYRTIENYSDHFDFLYNVTRWNKEKKNNAYSFNLYKFLHSELGLSKESIEKKFKSSPNLLKYYDEKCELDGNLIIEESFSGIEKIIDDYKNEIKKLDSFKKEFEEYEIPKNDLPFKQVEDIKCGIEKNIKKIYLKIKNIKKNISNEKNSIDINKKNNIDIKEKNSIENLNMDGDMENDDLDIAAIEATFMGCDIYNDDLDIAVTETIFKLMDFKILIKNYYRTIKNYSDHFDVLNNIFIKLNQENENNILPLNLYKFLTEKCDVKKENIEKKFEFCPNLIEYYGEKSKLYKNLIEKSFLEIKNIIEIYNEKVLELPNFSFELAKNNIDKNNCFIDEIKSIMGETEKNIKNINLKIESIKEFLNK